jgi:putative spermidine/putrescine transport system permease protein
MATQTTSIGSRRPTARRRVSAWLNRHPKGKLAGLLIPPMGFMGVIYLGALAMLLVTAFWQLDPLTSSIVKRFTLDNFKTLLENSVYRTITLRTVGVAALVSLADIVLAFPLAYYAARLASRRGRTAILIAVTLPLWSNYLVRAYAWRVILANNGIMNWTLEKLGLGQLDVGYTTTAVTVVFTYLWLPFVVFPIYAALERISDSHLEASSDLGATWRTTLRRVIVPLALPGIVAGSIFSFSLTLGDYVTPVLVGNKPFIGNVIYSNVLGVAGNVPFAAAYSMVPIAVMAIYLLIARRTGAFEAL